MNAKLVRAVDAFTYAVIVVAVIVCVLSTIFPVFGDELYVRNSRYSFGCVKQGTLVDHKYMIYNLHPWPSVIEHVIASCGCTTGRIGKPIPYTLAPMQRVAVEVMVDTSKKNVPLEEAVYIQIDHS